MTAGNVRGGSGVRDQIDVTALAAVKDWITAERDHNDDFRPSATENGDPRA